MKILVTGATGFTGSYVVPLLLQQHDEVHCLVRPSSDTNMLPTQQVRLVLGDLHDPSSMEEALVGKDVLVNIASLGSGHAANIISAARRTGIRRALFISSTSIFTKLNVGSKQIRLAAEESIRRSSLQFTILRPTMIFGSARDRNMCRLIRYLHRWPIVPVPEAGVHVQQPVYVADIAFAVVQCLGSGKTLEKTYNVCGATRLTLDQIIDIICHLMNRRVRKFHVRNGAIVRGIAALERFSIRLPVKSEQVRRLNEHKYFDYSDASRDFGYQPRSFKEGIRSELREMKLCLNDE